MALFHRATITPTKVALIARWLRTRPWGSSPEDRIDAIGSYRFDDPLGRVGMEGHLVAIGDVVFHVPLTYRDEPLDGAEDALICEMEHSALGTRWVYDGVRDPLFIVMFVAVAMTGQGEALGMVQHDGRWIVAPTDVRIHGGGWSLERVPVDGFELVADDAGSVVLRSDRFELDIDRRPATLTGERPLLALTATWQARSEPLLLGLVRELA